MQYQINPAYFKNHKYLCSSKSCKNTEYPLHELFLWRFTLELISHTPFVTLRLRLRNVNRNGVIETGKKSRSSLTSLAIKILVSPERFHRCCNFVYQVYVSSAGKRQSKFVFIRHNVTNFLYIEL